MTKQPSENSPSLWPARRRRRYQRLWWTAFLANVAVGVWQAVSPGWWIGLAWLSAACCVFLICSRRRFEHRMAMLDEEYFKIKGNSDGASSS